MKISKSNKIKSEYCCTVVKIGEIKPIKGKDLIGQTMVNGLSIVVRKDQIKEGDILIYAANETELNSKFISANNLFIDKELNFDKTKSGYFNKYGRVKLIKLGGCPSMGILFTLEDIQKCYPNITKFDLPNIGEDFDTINGELFVKTYIPRVKKIKRKEKNKQNKLLVVYDQIIPGEFSFHYDTAQLNREINRINPNDNIVITSKLHGTSIVIGNVLTNKPKWKGLYSKRFSYLPKFLQFTKKEYDIIYSSRTVIKNQYINSNNKNYYESDIWKEYYELLKDKISKGMTIYGEIIGYLTNSETMIQKGYDYGCKKGTNKLMIYRINSKTENSSYEWNVTEVLEWTNKLIENNPELKERIHPINILYKGTLNQLYPDIDVNKHWHTNVLEAIKIDKRLYMEELDPLCYNKVPFEGIVLRIQNDPLKEAWKLKTISFLKKESKEIDDGNIDIEMNQTY